MGLCVVVGSLGSKCGFHIFRIRYFGSSWRGGVVALLCRFRLIVVLDVDTMGEVFSDAAGMDHVIACRGAVACGRDLFGSGIAFLHHPGRRRMVDGNRMRPFAAGDRFWMLFWKHYGRGRENEDATLVKHSASRPPNIVPNGRNSLNPRGRVFRVRRCRRRCRE